MDLLLELTLIAVGVAIGAFRRKSDIAKWALLVLAIPMALGIGLAVWVEKVGNPWESGGTIAKYHMRKWLPEPLATTMEILAIGVLYGAPFVFGLSVGSSYWFYREKRVWLGVAIVVAS